MVHGNTVSSIIGAICCCLSISNRILNFCDSCVGVEIPASGLFGFLQIIRTLGRIGIGLIWIRKSLRNCSAHFNSTQVVNCWPCTSMTSRREHFRRPELLNVATDGVGGMKEYFLENSTFENLRGKIHPARAL